MRPKQRDNGFTLVELLVVVVLLGVVSAIFATSVINALGVDRRTKDRAGVAQQLTVANERMTREIRTAAPLLSVSPNKLVLESYTAGQRRRFTYTYDSTTQVVTALKEEFATPTAAASSSSSTTVLARQVVMPAGVPVFAASKRDGSATSTPKDVARITVTLVGKPRESAPVRVETSIFLRNYQG